MEAAIATQVGEPKLRFPASEKAWPFNFLSLVHRTTSHGGEVSASPGSDGRWLLRETFLLCPVRKAGEEGRGVRVEGEDIRDWKRWSKGLKEGVGLLRLGREAKEGRMLLPGEDSIEPCIEGVSSGMDCKEPMGLPALLGKPSVEPSSEASSRSRRSWR